MKTIKKLAVIAVRIILVMILLLNLTVIVLQTSEGIGVFDKLPVSVLPVISGSMEPEIRSGDIIITYQAKFGSLEVGDIVVFLRDEEFITHEIVAKNEGGFTTKGAANELPDSELLTEKEYKAKVAAAVPFLGVLWRAGSNVWAFLTLTVFLVLLLFGNDIFGGVYKRIHDGRSERMRGKS